MFTISKTELDKVTDVKLVPEIARVLAKLKESVQLSVSKQQSEYFVEEINKLYGENGTEGHKLDMTSVKSTNVNVGDEKFKIVNGSKEDNVDKLVMFSGEKPSKPKTDTEMMQGLDDSLHSKAAGYEGETKTLIKTKEFRYDYS